VLKNCNVIRDKYEPGFQGCRSKSGFGGGAGRSSLVSRGTNLRATGSTGWTTAQGASFKVE